MTTLTEISLPIFVVLATYLLISRGLALAIFSIGAAILSAMAPACSGAPAPTIVTSQSTGCQYIIAKDGKRRPVVDKITGSHVGCKA